MFSFRSTKKQNKKTKTKTNEQEQSRTRKKKKEKQTTQIQIFKVPAPIHNHQQGPEVDADWWQERLRGWPVMSYKRCPHPTAGCCARIDTLLLNSWTSACIKRILTLQRQWCDSQQRDTRSDWYRWRTNLSPTCDRRRSCAHLPCRHPLP